MANVYFTRSLQKKINEAGLNGTAVSLHPGVVRTELSRYVRPVVKVFMSMLYPVWWFMTKNVWQGAQTTLYLVYEDERKIQKGEYYCDCAVGKSSEVSKNINAAEKLWKIS